MGRIWDLETFDLDYHSFLPLLVEYITITSIDLVPICVQ